MKNVMKWRGYEEIGTENGLISQIPFSHESKGEEGDSNNVQYSSTLSKAA